MISLIALYQQYTTLLLGAKFLSKLFWKGINTIAIKHEGIEQGLQFCTIDAPKSQLKCECQHIFFCDWKFEWKILLLETTTVKIAKRSCSAYNEAITNNKNGSVKQQDKKVLTNIGSVINIYVVVHFLQSLYNLQKVTFFIPFNRCDVGLEYGITHQF